MGIDAVWCLDGNEGMYVEWWWGSDGNELGLGVGM